MSDQATVATDRLPTLYPLAREYLRSRQARGEIDERTAKDTYWHLLRRFAEFFGARRLDQLSPPLIDRWVETLGHYAPASRRQYISMTRVFCQWLVSTGKIPRDPTTHVRPVKEPRHFPRTLNEAEVGRLLAACPNRRARAIVWLMVGCGLRCVEVSRLTTADYDAERRLLHVTGKGGHERQVPVPCHAAREVDAYLLDVGKTRGPLIRNELDGRSPINAKTLSHYMRRWLRAAGVKQAALDGRSAHTLRRTAASDVMERSGEIRIVQEMLGHARLETTAKYYLRAVPLDKLREAMEGRDYGTATASPPVDEAPEGDELAARRKQRAG
ncbi:tyrosine-type recombinase/integrase [Desertimonas flava]|uniref:tyrosine-type recombinase/integrase n=1 Tax=Desertimonas flava TaxID=2064846 RepID=UPI000E3458C2|nr:tyrosine-type recombinase/integrase [Desertimonas flava]